MRTKEYLKRVIRGHAGATACLSAREFESGGPIWHPLPFLQYARTIRLAVHDGRESISGPLNSHSL
jgi:hypothetical protein